MGNQVVVRFDVKTLTIIRKVTKARGEDISDLVRRAVKTELARLSFLSETEKKALGVPLEAPVTLEKERRVQ